MTGSKMRFMKKLCSQGNNIRCKKFERSLNMGMSAEASVLQKPGMKLIRNE